MIALVPVVFIRSMKNTVYTYPDVWVCMYDTYGCDDLEKMCIDSSSSTEGGNTGAVFHPGGEYEQQILVAGILTHSVSMLCIVGPCVMNHV